MTNRLKNEDKENVKTLFDGYGYYLDMCHNPVKDQVYFKIYYYEKLIMITTSYANALKRYLKLTDKKVNEND